MSGKLLDNTEECSVFSFLVLTLQFFSLFVVPLPFLSTSASASHDSRFQSAMKEMGNVSPIYPCLLFWYCLYPDQDNQNIFLATLSFPVDDYTCDSLKRELTPLTTSSFPDHSHYFSYFFSLFSPLQSVYCTPKLVALVQKVLVDPDVAWKPSLFISLWTSDGATLIWDTGVEVSACAELALSTVVLEATKRGQWLTWPLGLWNGEETLRESREAVDHCC